MHVHVAGGTNAGRRRIRPAREPWFCSCYEKDDGWPEVMVKQQPGWRPECFDCGEKRPK